MRACTNRSGFVGGLVLLLGVGCAAVSDPENGAGGPDGSTGPDDVPMGGTASTTAGGGGASAGTPANGVGGSGVGGSGVGGGRAGAGGGSVSTGGSSGGAGAVVLGPPITGTPGVWEDVTPAGVDLTNWAGGEEILSDPVRPSDLYWNVDNGGVYRSTDYGRTWTKTNTGANGGKLNSGRAWQAAIDPNPNRDPNTLPAIYMTLGYGTTFLWKSTDGGVDWTNIWDNNIYAPDGVSNISSDVGADINGIFAPDPAKPDHLLAFLHSYWGTGQNNGIFESTDGGGKWIVRKSQTFSFQPHADTLNAIDGQTWLVTHGTGWPNSELWRTTDGGGSWKLVANNTVLEMKVAKAGSNVYAPGPHLLKSTDNGATWNKLPDDSNMIFVVWTSAKKVYWSGGGNYQDRNFKIRSAPIGGEASWTELPVPTGLSWVGGIGSAVPGYAVAVSDGTHTVLVTSNYSAGVWRYVEP
jgi:hypothetical protein